MRIAIAGVTGAGKSTLARRVSGMLHLPYTEIDSLYHGPGWVPRSSFIAEVDALTAGDDWVIEWQYRSVRPLIASRADVLVWLDFPAPVSLWRVVRCTFRRRFSREELWNGNREGPLWQFFTDRDHIIRWAFRTQWKLKKMVPDTAAAHPSLRIVRLRSRRAVEEWVASLA